MTTKNKRKDTQHDPHAITQEEQKRMESCDRCGFHCPWHGSARLRGYANKWICDHCDENYYDEEVRGEGNEDI